jgi:hypothetical protein
MSKVEERSVIYTAEFVRKPFEGFFSWRMNLRIVRNVPTEPYGIPRIKMTVEVND